MKPNDTIQTPDGPARLITMPIPGGKTQLAVVLYPDGRGVLVDLKDCRPLEE